jgi:uncharacterized protein
VLRKVEAPAFMRGNRGCLIWRALAMAERWPLRRVGVVRQHLQFSPENDKCYGKAMAKRQIPVGRPLTQAELDRLQELLDDCSGGTSMNIEELDGFFAALIAGPEVVMPSEYLPEVLGGAQAREFKSLEEANEVLSLLMRHWNTIARTLHQGAVYIPVLWEAEDGTCRGNDWARGFLQGVDMRREGWSELMNDKRHDGTLLPMFMLRYENDEDPQLRPQSISPELRETLIVHMAASLIHAYEYFRTPRQSDAVQQKTKRAAKGQTSRNDPCPCGSGKKYKHCCQAASVQ